MVKRQAAEAIERQKLQIVAALYSNPNWDQEEANRPEKIKELEKSFNTAIELIYHPERATSNVFEPDWNNPFWAGAKRAYDKQKEVVAAIAKQSNRQTVGQMVSDDDRKRMAQRQEARQSIDQMTSN